VSPSEHISGRIADLPQWQAEILKSLRELIHSVDSEIVEEWKWSTPVYSKGTLLCATGTFKDHVKLNFFKGALLPNQNYFNAGLQSKQSRAIDYNQGDTIDTAIVRSLIIDALNVDAS
jgi:hypothetical protein